MNNFKYNVSVRVAGSEQKLKAWREAYMIEPCRLKKDSNGEICYMLFQHAKKSYIESPLEKEIELALMKIHNALSNMNERDKKIKIIISIGIFCDENCGFIISPNIADLISLCNCDIDFFIYPPEQEDLNKCSAISQT